MKEYGIAQPRYILELAFIIGEHSDVWRFWKWIRVDCASALHMLCWSRWPKSTQSLEVFHFWRSARLLTVWDSKGNKAGTGVSFFIGFRTFILRGGTA